VPCGPSQAAHRGASPARLRYSEPKPEPAVACHARLRLVCCLSNRYQAILSRLHTFSPKAMRLDMRENASTPVESSTFIFGVTTTATRAAFAGVMHGEAELVEIVAGGRMQAQTEADLRRGWERARQAGTDAIRKFLGR
jgi:hypothetical protein